MIDMNDPIAVLIGRYVTELNEAKAHGDYDESGIIKRCMRREIRNLSTMVTAIEMLQAYGLRVS